MSVDVNDEHGLADLAVELTPVAGRFTHKNRESVEIDTKISVKMVVNMGEVRPAMLDNLLIPLPGFTLPIDFPWRIKFIAAVDEHLQRLRATGHYVPSRFFGYYFRGNVPMAVSGNWTVTLDLQPPMSQLPEVLEYATQGRFSIASTGRDRMPDYMLIHDRRDGACWLWVFEHGLRFVESTDPVTEPADSVDDARNPKLLGP